MRSVHGNFTRLSQISRKSGGRLPGAAKRASFAEQMN
jgi:hypothetical protein